MQQKCLNVGLCQKATAKSVIQSSRLHKVTLICFAACGYLNVKDQYFSNTIIENNFNLAKLYKFDLALSFKEIVCFLETIANLILQDIQQALVTLGFLLLILSEQNICPIFLPNHNLTEKTHRENYNLTE